MYCIKCGNKLEAKNKYCTKCGYPTNSNIQSSNNVNQYPNYQEKPKTNVAAIIITIVSALVIIGIIVLFIFAIFFTVKEALTEFETLEYVTFENDRIPTIYHVIGEKDICNISTSDNITSTQYNLTYCSNSLTKSEMNDYLDYLIENENFTEVENTYDRTIIKDSYDTNMKIKISIDYYEESITYYKHYEYSPNYDDYDYETNNHI